MSLFAELKRRNVFRVAAAYLVLAWLLIQIAETIFPLFGFDNTPARVVVVVLAIGFIPAMIVSWAFELTPEGLVRDEEVSRSQSLSALTGKKLDKIILMVLALALGYFALDKFVFSPEREAANIEEARQQGRSDATVEAYGDKSIAVLPLVDMSAQGDQEYLSDGIAEELTNLLAKIPELRVTSRSSAFAFKGEKINIPAIAKSLGVAYILEGSLRKDGNQLRITTQLIEARSDTHVWSETYDRSMDDIFAIQDEIAAAVVDELRVSLLGELPATQQVDPEAFRLFLLANYVSGVGANSSELQNADVLYKQALAIDPDFARAWRKLAKLYSELQNLGELTIDQSYSLQVEAIEKAISLDPADALIYTDLGYLESNYGRDYEKAAEHFRHAISLEPYGFSVLNNSALFLLELGRVEEAITVYEYLIAQSPQNTYALLNYARLCVFAGYPDQAIAAGEALLVVRPGAGWIRSVIGEAYLLKGEPEKALELFEQESWEGARMIGEAMAYYNMGQLEASDASLETFIREYGRDSAFAIASLFAYRDEADPAFEWLDVAFNKRSLGFSQNLAASHMLDNIRKDPRWLPFTERLNMSPAELDAIDFKITLPE